jgi:hypothetical protein
MDDHRPANPEDAKSDEFRPIKHKRASRASVFRSLTRLVIGGVLLGVDELLDNLEEWETMAPNTDAQGPAEKSAPEAVGSPPAEIITIPEESETSADLARYALIGLAFDAQDRLQSGVRSMNKAANILSRLATPIAKPFKNSRVTAPLRRRYDRLVLRGQQEVDRWVETGRTEDAHSRSLAQSAVNGSVDQSINFLTANEGVQELIQSQSVSLAGEVVEEVRERAVSADDFFEGVIRAMFRRPRRSELPEPPPEVKKQAVPFRQIRGRLIRK